MTREAHVMEYVRALGYPVPAVEDVSNDGLSMVIQRIEGVDMVAMMGKRPWVIPRLGRVLADLHRRLHELAAPGWLHDSPFGRGDRLLHLDLHPLNVMMSPRGPVVIDWTNACRGDPAVDVALAWVLMEAAEVPTGRFIGMILGRARSAFVKSFVDSFDVDLVKKSLRDVVAWKVLDSHMSMSEQVRMWQSCEGGWRRCSRLGLRASGVKRARLLRAFVHWETSTPRWTVAVCPRTPGCDQEGISQRSGVERAWQYALLRLALVCRHWRTLRPARWGRGLQSRTSDASSRAARRSECGRALLLRETTGSCRPDRRRRAGSSRVTHAEGAAQAQWLHRRKGRPPTSRAALV